MYKNREGGCTFASSEYYTIFDPPSKVRRCSDIFIYTRYIKKLYIYNYILNPYVLCFMKTVPLASCERKIMSIKSVYTEGTVFITPAVVSGRFLHSIKKHVSPLQKNYLSYKNILSTLREAAKKKFIH